MVAGSSTIMSATFSALLLATAAQQLLSPLTTIEGTAPMTLAAGRRVQEAATCSNGLTGIEGTNDKGSVCCPTGCNQCGGTGCGRSGAAEGLRNKDCCINGVLNSQGLCSDVGAAPCIIETPSCTDGNPSYIGDGECDRENNNADCNFDGGDCCECDCDEGLPFFCGGHGYDCQDPSSECNILDSTCSNGLSGIESAGPDWHIEEGDGTLACCPVVCGECGGPYCFGAGLPEYDDTGCCDNMVLISQHDCAVTGEAPCVIHEATSTDGDNPPGYLGCFQDDEEIRILPTKKVVSQEEMTAEFCKASCDNQDFDYYGTQYGSECWCGSGLAYETYTLYGSKLSDSACDMQCTGDSNESCGGHLVMSVYLF